MALYLRSSDTLLVEKQRETLVCERVEYHPTREEHDQTCDAEGRRHTREERARDGESRDEMRGVEWAAEGAPNGRLFQ